MNQYYLQIRKSACAFLLAMMFCLAGVNNASAESHLATLKHGDNISVFYGATALIEAHDAAEAGDVITLSCGVYVLDTITKAVTIHGTGYVTDSITGTAPTIITTDVVANVPSGSSYLTIEGVLFSSTFTANCLINPHFVNCYFGSFLTGENTVMMSQPQFFNCRFNVIEISQGSNSNFHNCVLWKINSPGEGMVAYNSFIRFFNEMDMSVINSIIYSVSHHLLGNSIAINCIGIGAGSDNYSLGSALQENCWTYGSFSSVFETFNGSYNPLTEPLILKEEIASTHLGTDGTEVGIYGGGTNPYVNRPSYLRIKRCTVGERTTDDGHLSVDIEVVTE